MSENVKGIINVDTYAIAAPNTRQLGIKCQGAKGSTTGTDFTQTWEMSDGGNIKVYVDAHIQKTISVN